MKKYVINEIYSDGYERFAIIEGIEHHIKLNVHFLEYDEYLEHGEKSKKKKKGDIIEGKLSIELVINSKKVDKDLIHYQEIQKSSHIEAIIRVDQIINEYSLYATTSISDDSVLIDFENVVDYKIGDRVLIIGSLEICENDNQ